MAETTTLARPYARAAFEVASQDNALQSWSNLLALFAAVAKQPAFSSWKAPAWWMFSKVCSPTPSKILSL